MAVNSYDPVDGHPIFVDSDAPDVKVDPTEAAKYAGKVGTRLVGTTAARTAYAFTREGLEWYDTDLDAVYIHTGAGWSLWWKKWTTFNPAPSNVAGGSLVVTGTYAVMAGMVMFRVRITNIGSVSGPITITLPINAIDATSEALVSQVTYAPASGSIASGKVFRNSASLASLMTDIVVSGQTYYGGISGSVPIVWAGARIEAYGQYPVA